MARLESEYFDMLHVNDVPENAAYVDFGGGATGVRDVSSFELEHFHSTNVTPDRPCSTFFKTDSFMPASEIFTVLESDGFRADHI